MAVTIRYLKNYPPEPDGKVPLAEAKRQQVGVVCGYQPLHFAGDVETLSASVARDRVNAGFAEFVN